MSINYHSTASTVVPPSIDNWHPQIVPNFVNGWIITTRLAGTNSEYHFARKNSRVHTSTNINYLIRLCKGRN